ncbi:MAG TPA: hypothetical protein VIC08_03230, partial [Cellvibrionaceae bacterium]
MANTSPVVDAGPDQTVNAGETVNINVNVTSNNTIVSRTASRISGPSVSLVTTDINSMNYSLVAPSTGTEDSVVIEYRFTVEDDTGESGSDTLVITVLRVNEAPTVSVGADQAVIGLTDVSLSATASDPDGEIASYQWEQTGGGDHATVVLEDSDTATPSFTAPSTDAEIALDFTVTATDNDGETATDTVTVTVRSENAPEISMHFPPAGGQYIAAEGDDSHISAYGVVEAKEGASIEKVEVSAGANTVTATLRANGHWRADNVVIPVDNASIDLLVTVTDSMERVSTTEANLHLTSAPFEIGSSSWRETTALAIEPGEDYIWLLTTGSTFDHLTLARVNVHTGEREESITDFNDESSGPVLSPFSDMAYDTDQGLFYLSSNPASGDRVIVSVDAITGQREIISGPLNTGSELENPISLALQGDYIYVADNSADTIVRVDKSTGARRTVAGENSSTVGIGAPICLESYQDSLVSCNN